MYFHFVIYLNLLFYPQLLWLWNYLNLVLNVTVLIFEAYKEVKDKQIDKYRKRSYTD